MAAALEKLKERVSVRQFQIFFLHVIKAMPALETARALGVNVARIYLVKHRVKPLFEKAVKEVEALVELAEWEMGSLKGFKALKRSHG